MNDITVIELSKAFIFQQKKSLVLHDVDLSIKKGEFCYLIGKTGSGKSSLLKTLYGELPLENGTGFIAGYDLRKIHRKEIPYLRRKLGIVFQDFQLLTDRNVTDNLMFVLKATGWKNKDQCLQRIHDVLHKVGLATKDYKMPNELSGGEQQRVVIARALLNDPEILLADEPTGNLDPDVTDDIMQLLKSISNNGRAVLMATHDYRIINKFPGTIYKCEGGRVEKRTLIT